MLFALYCSINIVVLLTASHILTGIFTQIKQKSPKKFQEAFRQFIQTKQKPSRIQNKFMHKRPCDDISNKSKGIVHHHDLDKTPLLEASPKYI